MSACARRRVSRRRRAPRRTAATHLELGKRARAEVALGRQVKFVPVDDRPGAGRHLVVADDGRALLAAARLVGPDTVVSRDRVEVLAGRDDADVDRQVGRREEHLLLAELLGRDLRVVADELWAGHAGAAYQ